MKHANYDYQPLDWAESEPEQEESPVVEITAGIMALSAIIWLVLFLHHLPDSPTLKFFAELWG